MGAARRTGSQVQGPSPPSAPTMLVPSPLPCPACPEPGAEQEGGEQSPSPGITEGSLRRQLNKLHIGFCEK